MPEHAMVERRACRQSERAMRCFFYWRSNDVVRLRVMSEDILEKGPARWLMVTAPPRGVIASRSADMRHWMLRWYCRCLYNTIDAARTMPRVTSTIVG